ncbi:MAG: HAMP domain-containing histidine kinase [Roseburia sp.]|nr:HAMP domain-containing histidine kinase [Roseburia sp.]MCM1098347.1 HAMP domain-containing histidine kinase [Ruminococcus flavefaciens]
MRLFTKIFLFGMLAFGTAFSVSGYFLLHYSLESSMARETDFALKQYQYDKFTVQSAMLSYSDVTFLIGAKDNPASDSQSFLIWQSSPSLPVSPETESENSFFSVLSSELGVPAAFFTEDHQLLFSALPDFDPSFLDKLSEDAHTYQFFPTAEGGFILVGSVLNREGGTESGLSKLPDPLAAEIAELPDSLPADAAELPDSPPSDTAELPDSLPADTAELPDSPPSDTAELPDSLTADAREFQRFCFVTQWDISKTLNSQRTLRQYFFRCYLIAVTVAAALLGILSALLTGPLKRMSRAARRMAEGDYGERLSLNAGGEVGDLAASLNDMAEAVEEKVSQLAKSAREKEDFAANLAHELKTPLTSIIGYADTIYQRELPRKELKKASWHIWNEGMRLEALSRKLMDLFLLEKQDFPLIQMSARELLQDTADSLAPLFPQYHAEFLLQAEQAEILAEYDLLKTLLLNLVDNSLKSGGSRIHMNGQRETEGYRIRVSDNGCGMEAEELSRITDAFYMIDKARSRRQHGAGLGLALAERIARLHGGSLTFQSQKGVGTEVSFLLAYAAEYAGEEAVEENSEAAENEEKTEAGSAEEGPGTDGAAESAAGKAGIL